MRVAHGWRVALPSAALALALGLGAGAAGAAKSKQDKDRPHPAEVSREGKILVVRGLEGGEPQLTASDGQRWLLVGLLREELLRLDGHKLRAWGVPGDKKLMMPTLDVSRYDIIDSGGGRRPLVGTLRRDRPGGTGLVLERKEGAPLEVRGSKPLLEAMEKRLRCKIWLLGDLEGQAVRAFKFGWLSCKAPKSIKTGKETK